MTTTLRTAARRTTPAKTSHSGCGCGCGGVEGRCCGLECLTRPNFFCGQLLTDADLATMVQWVRDRLSLVRYREGWGVVCGLEVSCCPPGAAGPCCSGKDRNARVYINPGYAIDCCGNDLVVCEPIPVDLGDICRPIDDPCADPCDEPPPAPDPAGQPGQIPGAPAAVARAPFTLPGISSNELVVADLFLRYGEQLAEGHRTMFRSGCSDVGTCGYARVLERPEAKLLLADPAEDQTRDADEVRRKLGQQKYTSDVQAALERIGTLLGPSQVDEVLRRLADYPIYSYCFLPDYIRSEVAAGNAEWRQQVGRWLFVDWVLHRIQCPCAPCRTDEGVPLARLYLRRKYGRAECCRVVGILATVPHRRSLRVDCRDRTVPGELFARFGQTVPMLKQDMGDAIDLREGATAEAADLANPGFEYVVRGAKVRPLTIADPFGVERVVAFRQDV